MIFVAYKQLWNRIKRHFGRYPGAYPMGRGAPKPRHAPIPLPELRQRIAEKIGSALNPIGFGLPSKRFDIWARYRAPNVVDLAGINFVQSNASNGMLQISIVCALHLPVIEKIYCHFAGGIYRLQSGTAGGQLYLAYPKEKLPTAWYFWTTAYSEEAMQMIIDQIIDYGLPLLEEVTDYETLLSHPFLSKNISTSKRAILLALTGCTAEAQDLLEQAVNENEQLRSRYAGDGVQEEIPEWKAHAGILQSLKSNQFEQLMESMVAG